jgi:hypothetical protein
MPKIKVRRPKTKIMMGLAAIAAALVGWQQQSSARSTHAQAKQPAALVRQPPAPTPVRSNGQG